MRVGRQVLTAVLASALVAVPASSALATMSTAPPALLVERDPCAGASTSPPPTGPVRAGETRVTFRVATRTWLRVDDGRVVAARTNTGCAPRAGDGFVVGDRWATAGEIEEALGAFRSGDWRDPGVWHHRA